MKIFQASFIYRQKNGRHSLMPAFDVKKLMRSIFLTDIKLMSFFMRLFEIFAVAAVYYLTARIGQKLAIPPGNVTPVWLPSGILLAAVFIRGYRIWPGIFIGAFIGNVWAYFDFTTFSNVLKCLFAGAANGVGDVLCIAGSAYLIERTTGSKNPFRKSADVIKFLILGAMAGPAVSAAFGVTALCITGFLPWADYLYALITWWTGDSIGVLIFAPLIITWRAESRKATLAEHPFELTSFALILIVTGAYCLNLFPMQGLINIPLFSLAPILIWSAFRLGQEATFTGVFVISALSVISTAMGYGPFSGKQLNLSLLELQWFIAIMSSTIFILSGLITEQSEAQNKLQISHHDLEVRVKERTLELKNINENLKREVSERKQIEEDLQKFAMVADSSSEFIGMCDLALKPIYVNPAGMRMVGLPDMEAACSVAVPEYFFPEDQQFISEEFFPRVLREGHGNVEIRLRHFQTGQPIWVFYYLFHVHDVNGNLIGWATVSRDITERIQAEAERDKLKAQMIQSHKMESIGTLAGGVAHEINNPINGIMNYAQLIIDITADSNPVSEYAGEIIHETRRVSTIVRNLLTFARQEKEAHSPARLKDIVDNTMSLIQTVFKRDQINLEIDISEDLPKIKCRSQQIQQVIMNIVANARDALNQKYAGYDENKKIRISSSLFVNEGRRWIRTTIKDTGSGISPEAMERMFDPFFTTKPRENGTGLGLSISYGIVKDHHGELSVESKSGQYTRFHVDLPVDNGWDIE